MTMGQSMLREKSAGFVRWARVLLEGMRHYQLERLNITSGLGQSAWMLYGLVRSLKPKVCVEIGSANGRSACFIGTGLRDNGFGKLYAIDPHSQTAWNDSGPTDTYAIMRANLKRVGVRRYVEVIRATSEVAAQSWQQPIDLLFIDGDHSYAGVKRDWDLFAPHMQPFGVTVFHDTLWNLRPDPALYRADMGVPRFVEELRQQGYPVVTIEQDFGVSLVQPALHGIALRDFPNS
jgi:predicted O-methyltransferase YrrM